jgi:hypothetical protein
MGYEFEVEIYVNISDPKVDENENYQWQIKYYGNDKERAFEVLEKLKEDHYVVRITWR